MKNQGDETILITEKPSGSKYGTPEDPTNFQKFCKWYWKQKTGTKISLPIFAISTLHFLGMLVALWLFILTSPDMNGNDPMASRIALLGAISLGTAFLGFMVKIIDT